MDRKIYTEFLKSTSEMVYPFLENILQDIKKEDDTLFHIMNVMYKRRNGKMLLKPALFRLTYELGGGNNFNEVLPIAVAFELLNISSYQANIAFDNKVGTLSKEEKDNQFIASMLSLELANKLIDTTIDYIGLETTNKIKQLISEANSCIYKAQHLDLNILTFEHLNKFTDYGLFFQKYTERCFLGSGIFSGNCAVAGLLCSNTREILFEERLLSFGRIYGNALHQINDLGDYFPDETHYTKPYQDEFSDLRNGRLTLPLYLLFEKLENNDLEKLKYNIVNKSFSIKDYKSIQTNLVLYGITNHIKDNIKHQFKEAKEHLEIFPKSDSKSLLLSLLSILDSNKFYFRINKIAA